MKKSKSKKQNNTRQRQMPTDNSFDFNDIGLEPPKIYRQAQRTVQESAVKRSNKQNLTRKEQRQRDNKKRKKRHKFRKIIVWLLVVLGLVAVGVVLSLTVFFRIETITVTGTKVYSKEQVISQCSIDTGENLFLADKGKSKEKLESNLPYIYNAQISRKLPSTLEIKITDATAAYSIKNKDKTYILLDNNFKVLEKDAAKSKGINILKADVVSVTPGSKIEFKNKTTGECLTQLSNIVKSNNLSKITAIYSNSIRDNYVVYDNRIKFKLGTCDKLENKIFQGLAACEKLDASNPKIKGTMTLTGGKSFYFTEE